MSIIKKPNAKGVTDVAIQAVSFVAGAKIGDGLAEVMPESVSAYKGYILAAVGIVGAACMNTATTGGKVAQNAMLGMGAKQLYNEVTKATTDAIAARTGTTATDKFVNALVGHNVKGLGEPADAWQPQYSLGAAWEETPSYQYQVPAFSAT